MHKRSFLIGFAVVIAASASAQVPAVNPVGTMTPAQAIAAATSAPRGARGTVVMPVQATGADHGHVFLNSEVDYRDPRNLTVDIDIRATRLLKRQLGMSPDQFYKGKRIEVRGTVRRVPVRFFDDYHRPTGQYYFQTHVFVREPGQISVIPAAL